MNRSSRAEIETLKRDLLVLRVCWVSYIVACGLLLAAIQYGSFFGGLLFSVTLIISGYKVYSLGVTYGGKSHEQNLSQNANTTTEAVTQDTIKQQPLLRISVIVVGEKGHHTEIISGGQRPTEQAK